MRKNIALLSVAFLVWSVSAQTVINYDVNYPDVPQVVSTSSDPVGAIPGRFDVSSIGSANYTLPIELPKGYPGMQPQIALVYDSQSGNGIAGYGCNISGLSSITRVPRDIYHDGAAHGIDYTCDDAFSLDGQRLIVTQPRNGSDSIVYCLENSPFTRITMLGANSSQSSFRVETPNGLVCNYSCRQPGFGTGMGATNVWYISSSQNAVGNRIDYSYDSYGSNIRLRSIAYGGNSVFFEYEARPDTVVVAMPGTTMQTDRRLKEIRIRVATSSSSFLSRIYTLNYDDTSDASTCRFSRLSSVTLSKSNGESLRPTTIEWNSLPQFACVEEQPQFYPSIYTNGAQRSSMSFFAADLNGDGRSDIVEMATTNLPVGQNYNFMRIYYAGTCSGSTCFNCYSEIPMEPQWALKGFWTNRYSSPTAYDADGDGICELAVPAFKYNDDVKSFGLRTFKNGQFVGGCQDPDIHVDSMEKLVWSLADFNNDGKTEAVVIEQAKEGTNSYYGAVIGGYLEEDAFSKPFLFTLPAKPLHAFTADMNNNGLTDIVVFYQNGYRIFWNDGTWVSNTSSSTPAVPSSYTTYSLAVMPSRVWQGDFNGDGVTDFLISAANNGNLYFALGDGGGNLSLSVAAVPGVYEQTAYKEDDDSFGCYVADLDGDGMSDVIANKGMYNSSKSFRKGYTYWLFSDGHRLIQKKLATTNNKDDSRNRFFVTGDFDGDGASELASLSYDCYNGVNASETPLFRIYNNGNLDCTKGKAVAFKDGLDVETQVTYKTLTDHSVYSRGNASDLSYPVLTLTPAITVVSNIVGSDGVAGSQSKSYSYEGLKYHIQGRGLIGMKATTVEDHTTGVTLDSRVTEWDEGCFMPAKTVETQRLGSLTATRTTHYVNESTGISGANFRNPQRVENYDLDGNYSYDDYYYSVVYGGALESHSHISGMGGVTTYNLGFHKIAGQYLPDTVSVWKAYTGGNPYKIDETAYVYNSKGQVTAETTLAGTPKAVTTSYSYDTWGNVLSSTTSGDGVETATTTFTYDDSHRFVTKSIERGYIEKRYTYDAWGNLESMTDRTRPGYQLKTEYDYDSWGNLVCERSPEGQIIYYERGWGNSADRKYFVVTQGTAMPWKLVWYDQTGRETYTEIAGPMGLSYACEMAYNSRGLLTSRTTATKKGESILPLQESFTYDSRGRMLTHNYDGTTTTHSYAPNQESVTKADRTVTTTYDTWGNVISIEDPSGTVTYQYGSNFKPKSVTANGSTVTMSYDEADNQIKLTDPDAGTMTYTYDAYGRLLTETDARGTVTVNTYDQQGRLSQSTTGNTLTTYTYGQTVSDRGLLLQTARDGNTTSYTYDQYGRVSTEKRKVASPQYEVTFSYAYNLSGLLSSTTYPGNVVVGYTYDTYGHHTRTTVGGQQTWALSSVTPSESTSLIGSAFTCTVLNNARGQITGKQLKDAATENVIRSMSYAYDSNTDNMTVRTGMFPQQEHFTYDQLDRLTSISYGGGTPHEICYAPNGNITYQTGIGKYGYSAVRPHAVSNVENTDGRIPLDILSTNYNGFGKASRLENHGIYLTVEYGPDNERCRTRLYEDGTLARTNYYMGDYEAVNDNNKMWRYYYLDGGVMYMKETGKADSLYYMFTDHLGSVTDIYNLSGNLAFSATYDAWGNQKVTKNTIGFHRGYTGHEHLPEFGLINMNGRLYDPVIGRFLSCDNFVQEPSNSQNFNRYSYCLNNPLKYTDPSGESLTLIGVFAAAFAVGNTVSHAIRGDIKKHGFLNNFLEGSKFFLQGAVTGASIASAYSYAPGIMGSKLGGFLSWCIKGYSFGQTCIGALGLAGGAINNGWKGLVNGAKLFLGNFYLDENDWLGGVWQGVSRHTWEMPQSMAGQAVSQFFNVTDNVRRVDYLGGATFSTIKVNALSKEKGVTIGNNIVAWNYNDISGSFDDYVIQKPLYMHEYGHTIDSRLFGPGYLVIGLASLISASKSKYTDYAPFSTHREYWTERRANRNAKDYFSRFYGVDWNSMFFYYYGWKRIEDVYPTH